MNVPRVPESAAMRFRTSTRARWSDEDCQGVVNNAVYLTFFEEARFAWARRLGLLEGLHFPFLLAATNVRFVQPARAGSELEVELATTRLGTSSFEQAYRLLDAASRAVLAEAEALLVCYDPETLAARPMSDQFRGAIAAFEGLS